MSSFISNTMSFTLKGISYAFCLTGNIVKIGGKVVKVVGVAMEGSAHFVKGSSVVIEFVGNGTCSIGGVVIELDKVIFPKNRTFTHIEVENGFIELKEEVESE